MYVQIVSKLLPKSDISRDFKIEKRTRVFTKGPKGKRTMIR